MAFLSEIWRHPIKSHGREQLAKIMLSEGKCLPWDRRWAVAHELAKIDPQNVEWVPCANFSRVAKAPKLQVITARTDLPSQTVTLSHPILRDLTIDPDNEADSGAFIQWVMRISPADRALPARLVRAPKRGMTDTDYPSISLINMSSHREVSVHLEQKLSHLRWRGNLILENLDPWEETSWVGQKIRIGLAELEIRAPITRCFATTVNTDTGVSDADTLGALQELQGAPQMGVYAVVTKTGDIQQGDTVELI